MTFEEFLKTSSGKEFIEKIKIYPNYCKHMTLRFKNLDCSYDEKTMLNYLNDFLLVNKLKLKIFEQTLKFADDFDDIKFLKNKEKELDKILSELDHEIFQLLRTLY